jgi:hypothetical protein
MPNELRRRNSGTNREPCVHRKEAQLLYTWIATRCQGRCRVLDARTRFYYRTSPPHVYNWTTAAHYLSETATGAALAIIKPLITVPELLQNASFSQEWCFQHHSKYLWACFDRINAMAAIVFSNSTTTANNNYVLDAAAAMSLRVERSSVFVYASQVRQRRGLFISICRYASKPAPTMAYLSTNAMVAIGAGLPSSRLPFKAAWTLHATLVVQSKFQLAKPIKRHLSRYHVLVEMGRLGRKESRDM